MYTVFRKNTHSHFLLYLHELFVDLNKNCICLAKVGASLQHAISRDPKDIIFCEYRILVGAYRRGRIVYYVK